MLHGSQRNSQSASRAERLEFALQVAKQAERVGGRIAELRQERGWSRPELARRLPGVSSGNDVYRWEKGKHLPRSDTLDAIAEEFGTTLEDLHAGPIAERPEREPTPDLIGQLDGEPPPWAVELRREVRDLSRQLAEIRQTLSKTAIGLAETASAETPQVQETRPPGTAEPKEATRSRAEDRSRRG